MKLLRRLLAALVPGLAALGAEGASIDGARPVEAAGSRIVVSFSLPARFDEGEILLAVEGGPRVRLTPELAPGTTRAEVVLPALAGRARFVLRAGRPRDGRVETPGEREERDIAFSRPFHIEVSGAARLPYRSAPTRRVPGGPASEWWATEPLSRPTEPEGDGHTSSSGLTAGAPADEALLTAKRVVRPGRTAPKAEGGRSPVPVAAARPRADRALAAFPGAAVPLLN
ncbi:MAG: hypothetical protein JNK60_07595 [Acidobacteria bacterium]|nr:hypothetical protein [Acidobacteriota bacterium]